MATYLNRTLNQQGRSRTWLARTINVTPSLISHYARLARAVPADRAALMADALGAPLSVIFDVRSDTSTEPQAPGGNP